jgi:hypothetical protein
MKRERLNYKLIFVIITSVIVLSLALTSCIGVGTNLPSWVDIFPSTSPAGSPEIQYIKLDVTCFSQAGEPWCIAACVKMVLGYYGSNVSIEEVANIIYNSDDNWFYALKVYCSSKGFIAKYGYLYIDNVRYYLQEGMPIIFYTTHATTCIGYNDRKEEFMKLTPTNCVEKTTSYSHWGIIATGDWYWQENYGSQGVDVQACWVIYPK